MRCGKTTRTAPHAIFDNQTSLILSVAVTAGKISTIYQLAFECTLHTVVIHCTSQVMESLISEVQKRRILWDKFHKQFKDRIKVDREWEAVGKELCMPSK